MFSECASVVVAGGPRKCPKGARHRALLTLTTELHFSMVLCALIPGSPFTRSCLRRHFATTSLPSPGGLTCRREVGGFSLISVRFTF